MLCQLADPVGAQRIQVLANQGRCAGKSRVDHPDTLVELINSTAGIPLAGGGPGEGEVVTSAGNQSFNLAAQPQWPATWANTTGFPLLFSVGSYWYPDLKKDLPERAPYSNFGRKQVSLYAYLTTQVPSFQRSGTELAFGTSISVPLVVRQLAAQYPRRGPQPPQTVAVGPEFFPAQVRDGKGNKINPHEVKALPVDCGARRRP
jgi:hypothetical protein